MGQVSVTCPLPATPHSGSMTKNPSPPSALRLIGFVTTTLLLLLLEVVWVVTSATPAGTGTAFNLIDFIRPHRAGSSKTSAFAVVPPTTGAPRPRTPCRQTPLFPWPAWEGPVEWRTSGTDGRGRRAVIRSSAGADGENEPVSTTAVDDPSQAEATSSDGQLSDEDISLVNEIVKSASVIGDEDVDEDGGGDKRLERTVLRYLPKMRPELVLALRGAASAEAGTTDLGTVDVSADLTTKLAALGRAMAAVLDDRLASARDLLAELLRAGEIRKLDGAIGRAARDGRLDSAFFTVLNANMDDAFREEQERESSSEEEGEKEESVAVESRLQILRHVYTRCQEEIEKAVSPGAGLLNKLLRTEQAPIRANQLRHYLGRQDSVTTPDGTKVPLKGGKALVSPSELISALSNAVGQIRQVEGAGGTDRVTAANLVESCRQVAIEARLAIGELYGTTSDELVEFERDLQPVFRPGSGSVDHRTETDSDSDSDSVDDKE